MKQFSDHALDKLIDLFNNHSHEVGSELKKQSPEAYKEYSSTDCITYALNVLSYAFEKSGNMEASKKVWKVGTKGTELAKYLVGSHGWKGVYINPDSKHPADADPEHTYTSHLASLKCRYYKIPLAYKVEDYSITKSTSPSFKKLNKHLEQTKLNSIDITQLKKVKFGFGISRGGRHTWLFSLGRVYEVHWDKIGDDLYESMSLSKFPWLSGAIVIPGAQAAHFSNSSKLICGAS